MSSADNVINTKGSQIIIDSEPFVKYRTQFQILRYYLLGTKNFDHRKNLIVFFPVLDFADKIKKQINRLKKKWAVTRFIIDGHIVGIYVI